MEEIYFKRAMSAIIVLILAVLSFFLIKPILLSIIMGLLLAFLFMPIYRWTYKYVKSKNLSASLICVLFMLILIIPMWLLTPMIIDQSFKFYLAAQQMDFITPFKKPSFRMSAHVVYYTSASAKLSYRLQAHRHSSRLRVRACRSL